MHGDFCVAQRDLEPGLEILAVSKSTAYWLVALGLVFPPDKNADMHMFNECYYCYL